MRHLLTVILFLSSTALFGQQGNTYVLKGTVRDSLAKSPIEFATVALTKASGQEIVGTTITDHTGAFEFRRVPQEDLVLTVSFMGYRDVQRNIGSSAEAVVDLGNISMREDATRLSDVVVEAMGNPIVFKKDTIEYTASSFKVAENAVLEDLIKKLPGAEIDSEGKITVHGKEIKRVTVDGQTFFADDPRIASRNLPAKMVDKVQVVDRKSDQAQFTGIDDGNEETILNLTVRPGMKNGWLGNLSAGAGHRDRYQAGGFVARFDNNWQLSFIGSGNNTNNRGFTDIAGSMMQSGRGSSGGGGGMMMMMGSRGGGGQGGYNLNVGGMSFNIGGNGITTSWLGGVNGVLQANKNLKIAGNYFYSGSDNVLEQERVRENIMPEQSDNYFYNQQSFSNNKTEGHRTSLEIEYTLDSLNSFVFKPNFGLGYGDFNEHSSYTSTKVNGNNINDGFSETTGNNDNLSASGDLLWRRKLGAPGRTFSANLNYGYNKNNTEGRNYSETHDSVNSKDSLINQRYNTKSESYNIGTRLSYTEPLGNNYYMELACSIRYSNSTSDKKTIDNITDQLDLRYSNNYDNTFVNYSGELNLRSVGTKYNYIIGVNVQPSRMISKYVSNGTPQEFTRSVVNFAPNAQYIYNFSDFKQFRLNYRGSTRQPSMNQLQPVLDNANPLFVNLGNPDLNPEFQHNLFGMYRNTNPKTFFTMFTMFMANYTFDRIVNASITDNSGRQTIIPVNTGGAYSANVRTTLNMPFAKNSKFFIMSTSGMNVNQTVSYIGQIDDLSGMQQDDIEYLLAQTQRNNTQNLNLTEMLRLNYRGTKLDASISGRANWTQAWYSIANRAGTNYWSNAVGADFNWTLPWSFTLASDINHNYYIGYGSGYDKPMTLWNAELTKQVFKSKQGTISVKVYDILNEGRGTSHTTTNNYIEDLSTNTLGRYIMFGFTYRFGSIGGQRTGGFRVPGGPGGHGPGGHGPGVQVIEMRR